MNEETLKTIEVLESAFDRLNKKENVIYFLTYDTRNNPRASIKYIYDLALRLKETGYNSKILVEDKSYTGVNGWLDERYDSIPVISIKDDKPNITIDDFVVVPEYYSNYLPQLEGIKCNKIMLVQQLEYIYETLDFGSRWIEYGFDKCITTTQESKKYIDTFFPNMLTYIIPPFIDDVFKPTDLIQKPYVAIHTRDRSKTKKIMSEFYLKYPHLRWITFRDMVQLSYDDFAMKLSECMISVWVDNESTFGTFPLESMKSNVPVIAKMPNIKPEWMDENAIWVSSEYDITEMLGSFIMSWIDGNEIFEDFKTKMIETSSKYNKENFNDAVDSIFSTIHNNRVEVFNKTINNLKNKE